MKSEEHINRAEEILADLVYKDGSSSTSWVQSRAILAQAHIAAATFRKAEEDRESVYQTLRRRGPG